MEIPTSDVLKNRGYPVIVYELEKDAQKRRPVRPFTPVMEDGQPVTKECWVKFTNLVISDIEEHFGSVSEWATALQDKPFQTIIDTLAIAWRDDPQWANFDRRAVGAALVSENMDEYATAVGSGYMLANGIEADAVVRVLTSGIMMGRERRARVMAEAIDSVLNEAESIVRGDSGTQTSQTSESPGVTG